MLSQINPQCKGEKVKPSDESRNKQSNNIKVLFLLVNPFLVSIYTFNSFQYTHNVLVI